MTSTTTRARLTTALAALTLAVSACAPSVNISRTRATDAFVERNKSILTSTSVSERTMLVLRSHALDEQWRAGDHAPVIERVRELDRLDPTSATAVPLAELLIAHAEQGVALGDPDVSFFLDAAHAAFRKVRHDLTGRGGMLDGRTAFAADLYNRAVSRVVTLTEDDWPAPPGYLDVAGEAGWFRLYLEDADGNPAFWQPDYFDDFVSAHEVAVEGMRNHHRVDAFGAPLVAIRENNAERDTTEPFLPPEGIIYPATAVIEFDGTPGGTVDASLRLYRPDADRFIRIGGQRVLLSEDLTAPLATTYARTELGQAGIKGLTEVEEYLDRVGIYMKEPYDPDKIPVLFVHGLRSSPITWRDTLNDLRADPRIRENYQFWKFLYPTGLPIPTAALYLRDELDALKDRVDPARAHEGPRNMIVVGHSMGGLISKTLTHDSGDRIWQIVFTQPYTALQGSPALRAFLARVFFYEPDPDVKRVVFIATPHRGSTLATSFIGSLGRSMIELPQMLQDLGRENTAFNRDMIRERFRNIDTDTSIPTSIHNLEPDSPTLIAYDELGIGVPHHSIIGDRGRPDADPRSDGVVTYDSSSLDTAESELVVPADHNAHAHPLAIEELRRILLEHLAQVEAERSRDQAAR